MFETISASAKPGVDANFLPVGAGAEAVPALLAAGHVLVHEHVHQARHARSDERSAEEDRRQADLPEDVDFAQLREHADLGAMRALVVAFIRAQLEEPGALRRGRRGNLDAGHVRERGQQRQLLPHVDRIARRRVQVRACRLHEHVVALEPGFDRQQALERGRGRQHEDRRRRQAERHLEHADRRVPETVQRRDGRILQKLREPPRLCACLEDVLSPDVELGRYFGCRRSLDSPPRPSGRRPPRATPQASMSESRVCARGQCTSRLRAQGSGGLEAEHSILVRGFKGFRSSGL